MAASQPPSPYSELLSASPEAHWTVCVLARVTHQLI